MAKVRFSHLDDFVLKDDGKVGIGTSLPSARVEVIGTVRAANIKSSSGITTFISLDGFVNKNMEYSDNVTIDSGDSGTLSGEIVIGAGLTMTIGTGVTTGQGRINSMKVSNTFTPPIGGTNDRPSAPQPGSLFYNKDFRTIEYWDGNFWRQVDNTTTSGRVVIAGGTIASNAPVSTSPTMHSFNINTFGNSSYFGEMIIERRQTSCCGNSVRSQIWGGQGNPSNRDNIDYFNIASEGNAIEFGVMLGAAQTTQALSSSTRGISYGHGEPESNQIQYTELATLGDAVDFDGDCALATRAGATWASPTRGMLAGGAAKRKHIEYMTIASKGVNGTDFGELTEGRRSLAGCSNSVRGLCMGGYDGGGAPYFRSRIIDYVTIASTGNATYFGDMSIALASNSCAASSTRGINAGGSDPSSVNNIDYVTIASTGNSMDFGDLSEASWSQNAAVSDCHGGLGGY